MKYLITSFCLLLSLLGCNNLLLKKNRKNFYEQNSLQKDSLLNLRQEVCYSRQGWTEGYCHILSFAILDTLAAKKKKILDLETDTLVIKSDYEYDVHLTWNSEGLEIKGQVEILEWKKQRIKLKEDVRVSLRYGSYSYRFRGSRWFKLE